MYIDPMAMSYHVSAPWPLPCTHNGAVTYIHVHALVAQLVECSPSTQNVAGSNPARGSSFFLSRKKGVVFGRSCLLCLVSLNEFTCMYMQSFTCVYAGPLCGRNELYTVFLVYYIPQMHKDT